MVLFSCLERGVIHVKKLEFSKKLLIADYAILILMVAAFFVFAVMDKDTSNCAIIIGGWIAQIAISSGAYYWKAKAENIVKLPITMLKEIPEDMKEKADPNQIIASILGLGNY